MPKIVEANAFRLVDDSNRVRADLSLVDGEPLLRFMDESGFPVCTIGLSAANEPGLSMFAVTEGNNRTRKLDVRVTRTANIPIITLSDDSGNDRIRIAVAAGQPMINMKSADGNLQITALVDDGKIGAPDAYVSVSNTSGGGAVMGFSHGDEMSYGHVAVTEDKSGSVIWRSPSVEDLNEDEDEEE